MDEKTKELMAIAASVALHCQPCLKSHIGQALNLGINSEEIDTAISVGKTVGKGAFKAMDNFSQEQMDILNSKEKSNFDAGCGCGCGVSDCCSQ